MEHTHKDVQLIYGSSALFNTTPKIKKPILIFPGMALSDDSLLSMDDQLLSRHLLLLGGSGCGKTKTFFHAISQIRNQMNQNDVAIIFDSKGEYYDFFHCTGDLVIGNDKKFRPISYTPNLFLETMADGLDDAALNLNAREVASALFYDRGSTTQPFFSNAAKDLFWCIMMHFLRSAKRDVATWGNRLNHKSLLDALRKYQVDDYRAILSYYPDMRSMVSYLGDGTSNQALGVLAELNSMISDYFIGVFADHIPGHSVSMREAVRRKQGKAIFLEYDLSIGETLTPIYRLLVDQALKEALGRCNDGAENGRVYLFADEFKLLPKLQHIDDALNFGRSLGVRVLAGIQSIDQLYDIYGERKGAVLAGGFGSIFAYHTNDDSSRKYISGRFGTNLSKYQFTNRMTNEVNDGLREGNTIEVWDQMDLSVGQAVIGLGGFPPFIYQFDDYCTGGTVT